MSGPFTTRLARRTTVADGVVDLVFELVDPPRLDFRAGQFVTLTVGKDPATGKDLRRSYSLASRSDQGEALRFLIKVIPGGPGSEFFHDMPLGGEVAMTGPHGFFVLDPEHQGDVVFAATGTGLAPMIPMIAELGRHPQVGNRYLYWGLRAETDLFVSDEIRALCAHAGVELHTYLSKPSPEWTGLQGRITAAILDKLPSLRAPTFYLCGSGAMITELKKELIARGIDRKKQIRTEAFFD